MAGTSVPGPLAERVRPLVEVLRTAHGDGLRSVIAYGDVLADPRLPASEPVSVLVVLADASAGRLCRAAADIHQARRRGLEPLFMASGELAAALDVFPLELLDMQAAYYVIWGEDVLAGVTPPRAPLRLHLERQLRSANHWLRQEAARLGHQPRAMRAALAQSFAGLHGSWRALLVLAGETPPAQTEALLARASEVYGLPTALLDRLRRLELGGWQPDVTELTPLVESYDGLLCRLVEAVDALTA
jgi:hypothetical protein